MNYANPYTTTERSDNKASCFVILSFGVVILTLCGFYAKEHYSKAPSLNDQDRVEKMTQFVCALQKADYSALPKPITIKPEEWEKIISSRNTLQGDFVIKINTYSTQDDRVYPDYIITFAIGTILKCTSSNGEVISNYSQMNIFRCSVETLKQI